MASLAGHPLAPGVLLVQVYQSFQGPTPGIYRSLLEVPEGVAGVGVSFHPGSQVLAATSLTRLSGLHVSAPSLLPCLLSLFLKAAPAARSLPALFAISRSTWGLTTLHC